MSKTEIHLSGSEKYFSSCYLVTLVTRVCDLKCLQVETELYVVDRLCVIHEQKTNFFKSSSQNC